MDGSRMLSTDNLRRETTSENGSHLLLYFFLEKREKSKKQVITAQGFYSYTRMDQHFKWIDFIGISLFLDKRKGSWCRAETFRLQKLWGNIIEDINTNKHTWEGTNDLNHQSKSECKSSLSPSWCSTSAGLTDSHKVSQRKANNETWKQLLYHTQLVKKMWIPLLSSSSSLHPTFSASK